MLTQAVALQPLSELRMSHTFRIGVGDRNGGVDPIALQGQTQKCSDEGPQGELDFLGAQHTLRCTTVQEEVEPGL